MKITDYEKVQTLNDQDLFLIDGETGTKTILASVMSHQLLNFLNTQEVRDKFNIRGLELEQTYRNHILVTPADDCIELYDTGAKQSRRISIYDFYRTSQRFVPDKLHNMLYWERTFEDRAAEDFLDDLLNNKRTENMMLGTTFVFNNSGNPAVGATSRSEYYVCMDTNYFYNTGAWNDQQGESSKHFWSWVISQMDWSSWVNLSRVTQNSGDLAVNYSVSSVKGDHVSELIIDMENLINPHLQTLFSNKVFTTSLREIKNFVPDNLNSYSWQYGMYRSFLPTVPMLGGGLTTTVTSNTMEFIRMKPLKGGIINPRLWDTHTSYWLSDYLGNGYQYFYNDHGVVERVYRRSANLHIGVKPLFVIGFK